MLIVPKKVSRKAAPCATPLADGALADAGLVRPAHSVMYVRRRCPSRLAQVRGQFTQLPSWDLNLTQMALPRLDGLPAFRSR